MMAPFYLMPNPRNTHLADKSPAGRRADKRGPVGPSVLRVPEEDVLKASDRREEAC
jgi:hypothetical protein